MSNQATLRSLSELHKADEDNKPEGGWGWVVVFAAMAICSVLDGYTYSTNQFYEQFRHEYRHSGSVTSIYGSVMTAVVFIISPFASGLIKVYGTGLVSLFGTFLAVFGIILSVYLDGSVYYHIFTIGIIAGSGIGMVFICQVIVVTYWFEAKIALATGIAECGSGFGMAVFSLIIHQLIKAYGWRGAQLILAGFMSLCIGLSSFHSAPTVTIWRSWKDMFCRGKFITALQETINFGLLWGDTRFAIFAASNCLLSFVFFMPLMIVTDRIKVWRIGDASDAAQLMFFFGIANGIGRITFGWIATCSPHINQIWLYIISTGAMGVCVGLTNLADKMELMYFMYFAIGLFYGGNVCLCSVVLIEMLGPHKVANAYGIVAFINGLTSALGPPLMNQMIHDNPDGAPSDIYATVMLVSSLVIVITTLMLVPNAIYFQRYCPTEEANALLAANLILQAKPGTTMSATTTTSIHLLPPEAQQLKMLQPTMSGKHPQMQLMPKMMAAKAPKIQNLKHRSHPLSLSHLSLPREKRSINTKIKMQLQQLSKDDRSIKVVRGKRTFN